MPKFWPELSLLSLPYVCDSKGSGKTVHLCADAQSRHGLGCLPLRTDADIINGTTLKLSANWASA